MKILVTGAAGFIGFHTCLKLVIKVMKFMELIILTIIMILN
jgi:nucleoside-diphosphate-sugar epimerase